MGTTLILVNGHSGSGKTTLANWLATEFGVPCLSKDRFKETLYDHQPPADREASRELGRLAYDLTFAAVEAVLTSRTSVILEAPLHREFSQQRIDQVASRHGAGIVQVLLTANAEVLEARSLARRRSGKRHAGHDVGFTVDELRSGVATPIDAPEVEATLEVDTNDFDAVDRTFVLAWLHERLGTAASGAL